MRKTGIKLAGLAAVLVGVTAAGKAAANDVTVTTATTTPLATSSPDGVSPGNVTIDTTGAITVTAGQSAVTLDSNNNVTNNGTNGILATDADNATGIRIVGGFTGNVANNGAISITETYQATDADSDGDLDGEWAQGTNRHGILLQAGAAHTGNITSAFTIAIEGDNSAGIRLDAQLIGNLTSSGNLNIVGDNSAAIAITGGAGAGVTGNVNLTAGTIGVRGVNARGVLIDAPIGGAFTINGQWNVSGYHSTNRPFAQNIITALDADDLLQGGSAVEVRYSIGGGMLVAGIGVEDDVDDDGDGQTEADGDTNDDLSANLASFGVAPTILISADPSANLALGPTASGYGIHIRGNVSANGVYDTFNGTGIRIEGSGSSTTTTSMGLLNDGSVSSNAFEATAYGLHIGANATVPSIVNRRSLTVSSTSETLQNAYGILIDSGATVTAINNSGTLTAQMFGELGNAHAIVDRSNTLATITNSGSIQALTIPTDENGADDIIPVAMGDAIAIDLSLSTINTTLNQVAATPFTDDDTVDDDANTLPAVAIRGDIIFGSGNDTFNLLAGTVGGRLEFGAGADAFLINNGAHYQGRMSDSGGGLTVDVVNGTLDLLGGAVNITTADFRANSLLRVELSPNLADSTLITSTGTITFAPGAVVTPIIPAGLPISGTSTFLTAGGGLIGGANVERVITGSGAPWIYNLEVAIVPTDANSLEARYLLKSTTDLGLNNNESAAFQSVIAALRLDPTASFAFASLITEDTFFDAYEDLLPSFSAGATELAATAIQQAQGAASNRLAATRLRDLDEVSVWAQEIGYGLTREPLGEGIEFRGHGFGLALGIDGPLDNGALFGLSASFIASQVEEPGRPDGELSTSFGQVNAYLGTAMGPIDLDLVGGLGLGRMSSRRFIQIGQSFSELSEADWWAYEGHGSVRASLPLSLTDWFVITPQAALTYVVLNESSYTEEGGGDAFDFDVDSATSQRLWADAGIEFAGRLRMRGAGMFAPRLFLGYRANVLDEAAERTFRYVSGAGEFTLEDEPSGDGAPLIGIGIDATNGYSTFSLSYEGEFGDEIDRHSLNAAVRFRF